MDPKLKTKWLKALRSGSYKQTKGYLRHGNKYCCIGVLCEIQGADFKKLNMRNLEIGVYKDGLSAIDVGRLAEMNDGTDQPRKSFKEIADYIEKNH